MYTSSVYFKNGNPVRTSGAPLEGLVRVTSIMRMPSAQDAFESAKKQFQAQHNHSRQAEHRSDYLFPFSAGGAGAGIAEYTWNI